MSTTLSENDITRASNSVDIAYGHAVQACLCLTEGERIHAKTELYSAIEHLDNVRDILRGLKEILK